MAFTMPWYQDIQEMKEKIMGEVQSRLDAVGAQLSKASTEITGLIDQLRQQLVDAGVDPATLDQLTAAAQSLDDIVPDAPPEEPPAEEPSV